jgi:hypothetical protein
VSWNSHFIRFDQQNKKNPDGVDEFAWNKETGWRGPQPVRLRGSGRMEDNIWNAALANWEAIPTFVANAEKEALAKGMLKPAISGITLYLVKAPDEVIFSAVIRGERREAHCTGDIKTGAIKTFLIR